MKLSSEYTSLICCIVISRIVGMYVGVCIRLWLGCGGDVDVAAPPPPISCVVVTTVGGIASDGFSIIPLSLSFYLLQQFNSIQFRKNTINFECSPQLFCGVDSWLVMSSLVIEKTVHSAAKTKIQRRSERRVGRGSYIKISSSICGK